MKKIRLENDLFRDSPLTKKKSIAKLVLVLDKIVPSHQYQEYHDPRHLRDNKTQNCSVLQRTMKIISCPGRSCSC